MRLRTCDFGAALGLPHVGVLKMVIMIGTAGWALLLNGPVQVCAERGYTHRQARP
mgnify:CR=1 FL=1